MTVLDKISQLIYNDDVMSVEDSSPEPIHEPEQTERRVSEQTAHEVGSVALLTSVDVSLDLSPGAKYDDITAPTGAELSHQYPEIAEDKKIRELLEQLDKVQRYNAYALLQHQTDGMPIMPGINPGMGQFSA